MRRILASVVFGVLVATAAAWPTHRAVAQLSEEELQRKAEAFVRLWEQLLKTQDPGERIAWSEEALKLEGELDPWPLSIARDVARGRLWWWSGLGYSAWRGGKREENLERTIAAYERSVEFFTLQAHPAEWAWTQDALGAAYRNRIRGDRADNVEKAIALYKAGLTVQTREAHPREWARTQHNLAIAYEQRLRGDRAENLEEAIALYEAILTVQTPEALPSDWAATQGALGVAYRNRIRGDRADNLEKAIALYKAGLSVQTREAHPREWAQTQHHLAIAYVERLRGDRAENLEEAIALYEAILTVRTREALPSDWAATQHDLAIVYENRLRGDRADNQEQAIALYKAALTVRTRETLPLDWATTQHSLGVIYANRVRGDRADNLEKSIEHLQAALSARTPTGQPREWADAQRNLGVAFGLRTRGERADNAEQGIAALEAALTVLNLESFPQGWAQVQSSLALLYVHRIRGQRVENLEKAIVHLHSALKVLTRGAFPRDWGMAQYNLGFAYHRYHEHRVGNRAENLDRAIRHLEAALTVMTREADPRLWAAAQMELGRAQSNRVGADPEAAIAAYEAALAVFNREDFPLEWSIAQGSLGAAYLDSTRGDRQAVLAKAIGHVEAGLSVQRQSAPRDSLRHLRVLGAALSEKREWQRAAAAYADARETFLLLLAQGLDDTAAAALIEQVGPLFSEAAYAAAQVGETEKALTLASEGRARLMSAALKLQALDLPADKRQRLDALRADIRVAERTMEAPTTEGAERTAAVEKLIGLRQELIGLVNEATAAEAGALGSALAQARALAGRGGAVAVPVVTRLGSKILILTRGSDPQGLILLDLPELTKATLDKLVLGVGTDDGWLGAYAINLLPDDDAVNQLWPKWMAAVDGLGTDLWRLFGARLDAALKQAGVRAGARLTWLPTGALGILPLGLVQDPAGKRLLDSYEVVYAPSLDALASAHVRVTKAEPATLAVVINPTGDLPAAEQEGRLVASRFPAKARTVLEGWEATPEAVLSALRGRSYWHFASHGTFSWRDPRQSALLMHGLQRLSVGRLLDEAGGLGRPRLVVLSACETGLYDISRNPDEFIGLPGTFTALGAAGVLGTLWPVNDMATSLLIAKFYDLHLPGRLAPPTALRRAQLWLRRATNADLLAYARGAARQGRLDRKHVAAIEEELSADGLRRARSRRAPVEWIGPEAPAGSGGQGARSARDLGRPYAHPYYWAGFIYTGL
jgi:CHAT domain-containing protein